MASVHVKTSSKRYWRAGGRHWTPLSRALDLVGDRWTLMIMGELLAEPLRIRQLAARMPGIAPGDLKRLLHDMVARGLVFRRPRELRPRIEYGLTDPGRELIAILEGLSRWGMRRAWSAPGADEHIEIDMLIRQLPLLLDGAQLPSGVIELIVERPDDPLRRVMSLDRGQVTLLRKELHSVMPWARLAGDEQSWIAAFGPKRVRDGLVITGDRGLASALLDALPHPG
jgi:DNA-binding HxlR family transcriptional regulator